MTGIIQTWFELFLNGVEFDVKLGKFSDLFECKSRLNNTSPSDDSDILNWTFS